MVLELTAQIKAVSMLSMEQKLEDTPRYPELRSP